MRKLLRQARRNPSAVLLIVQMIGILAYPFFEAGDHMGLRTFVALLGLVVLVLAILTVRASPAATWLSILLGIPLVVLTIVDSVTGNAQPWHLVSDALHAVFYLYTTWALIRYMFADHEATSDEIWATGATFTVGVWAFAYIYSIVQTLIPGSFAQNLTWMNLLFLSGTTMTNTGLSDIVPVKPHARSLVMVQEFCGIMYLALVVGRVATMTRAVGAHHANAHPVPVGDKPSNAPATGPAGTPAPARPAGRGSVDGQDG